MAQSTPLTGQAQPAGNPWARRAGLLLVAALPIAGIAFFVVYGRDAATVQGWLAAIQAWSAGLGVWGPIAYVGLYSIGAVIGAPGSLLTMASGALFGLAVGTPVVLAGATIGASLAFLIARYLAREAIAA